MMDTIKRTITIFLVPACLLLNSCASTPDTAGLERMSIGLLLADTDGMAWKREKGYFRAKADEFGVEVLTRVARGYQEEQNRQARELIGEGVGVLVVHPVEPGGAGVIVERAHQSDIPILSYGNLVRNAEVDLYVAPDRDLAGYLQARELLERSAGGGSIILGRCEDPWCARRIRRGQLRALKEWEEREGEVIPILHDSVIAPPTVEFTRKLVDKALKVTSRQGEKIGTIMASGDLIASGAIEALGDKGISGSVPVGGMGSTLSGCRRIIEGTQALTLYIPPREIGVALFRAAVRLGAGVDPEEIIEVLKYPEMTLNNGTEEIPALLVRPVIVTRSNLIETVVLDGLYTVEELYSGAAPSALPLKR
ncbi:MAG: substrate-binding domain-containing protein [Candidatus Auribacterota bacterium]|nr:substrate-binding domain-containing protein [Candidatus Auribacterota bacterium]